MAEMVWQSIEPVRRELTFGFYMPSDWQRVPIPEDAPPDFSDPRAMLPLAAFMATYGALIFAVAARPAFEDGTPEQWLAFLADRPEHQIDGPPTPLRLGNVNAVTVTGTQVGEGGLTVRMRMALVHAGDAIVAMSIIAPESLWDAMQKTFNEMLGSFSLALIKHPPLEAEKPKAAVEAAPPPQPVIDVTGQPEQPDEPTAPPADAPTRPADVKLADDASSFDENHPTNAYFRDSGNGLVPRLLELNEDERCGVFGCGAIVASIRVPFGWHIIDDGKRVLVFDRGGDVQVNLNLFDAEGMSPEQAADRTVEELSREVVGFEHVRLELMGLPAIGVKYIDEDGEPVEQGYLFKPFPHDARYMLKVRATAKPAKITLAMNLMEVLLRDLRFPSSGQPPEAEKPAEPEHIDTTIKAKGDPEWWTEALELERTDRLKEAENVIARAADKLGGPRDAMLASLYERRYERLSKEGDQRDAIEAARTACRFMDFYAAGSTSGSEGTARSAEAAQFKSRFQHLL